MLFTHLRIRFSIWHKLVHFPFTERSSASLEFFTVTAKLQREREEAGCFRLMQNERCRIRKFSVSLLFFCAYLLTRYGKTIQLF